MLYGNLIIDKLYAPMIVNLTCSGKINLSNWILISLINKINFFFKFSFNLRAFSNPMKRLVERLSQTRQGKLLLSAFMAYIPERRVAPNKAIWCYSYIPSEDKYYPGREGTQHPTTISKSYFFRSRLYCILGKNVFSSRIYL